MPTGPMRSIMSSQETPVASEQEPNHKASSSSVAPASSSRGQGLAEQTPHHAAADRVAGAGEVQRREAAAAPRARARTRPAVRGSSAVQRPAITAVLEQLETSTMARMTGGNRKVVLKEHEDRLYSQAPNGPIRLG